MTELTKEIIQEYADDLKVHSSATEKLRQYTDILATSIFAKAVRITRIGKKKTITSKEIDQAIENILEGGAE